MFLISFKNELYSIKIEVETKISHVPGLKVVKSLFTTFSSQRLLAQAPTLQSYSEP